MERSKPLKRSELSRGDKPLTRSSIKRKAAPAVSDMARRRVRDRSRGVCEAGTPVCDGRAVHVHHKQGRGALLDTTAKMLDVCKPCHDYIHSHPAESYEQGWLIKRND